MRSGWGMLVTHGCTLDKGTLRRVSFALVQKADTLAADLQGALRAQELASYVFLPQVPGLGDCMADLRVLVTVPDEVLGHKRLGQMTPEAKLLLEAKLLHFFTRINESWLTQHLVQADRSLT